MRIAVISDTHDRCPSSLPEALREADEIWHLGDVCDPALLAAIVLPGRPLHVIQGNCDAQESWPLALTLARGGMSFYLIHIPPRHAPTGVQAVLHGHTHVPRDETIDGVRWLNPGSASQPRSGSAAGFAWLTIGRDGRVRWELQQV
jgi:putative phosphoesterase